MNNGTKLTKWELLIYTIRLKININSKPRLNYNLMLMDLTPAYFCFQLHATYSFNSKAIESIFTLNSSAASSSVICNSLTLFNITSHRRRPGQKAQIFQVILLINWWNFPMISTVCLGSLWAYCHDKGNRGRQIRYLFNGWFWMGIYGYRSKSLDISSNFSD